MDDGDLIGSEIKDTLVEKLAEQNLEQEDEKDTLEEKLIDLNLGQ